MFEIDNRKFGQDAERNLKNYLTLMHVNGNLEKNVESMLIVILDENFSLHHTTLYLLDEFLLLHKKNDFFFWWFMNHFSHDEPHLLAPADDDFLKFFKKHFDEGELNRCVIRQEENFFRILNIAISPNSLSSNST